MSRLLLVHASPSASRASDDLLKKERVFSAPVKSGGGGLLKRGDSLLLKGGEGGSSVRSLPLC